MRFYYWFKDQYSNIKWFLQKLFRGYSDLECWDVGRYTLLYMLPRLKQMRKNVHGHPANLNNLDQWHEIIDKLIWAIEKVKADDSLNTKDWLTMEEWKEIEDIFERYLGKYILALWD